MNRAVVLVVALVAILSAALYVRMHGADSDSTTDAADAPETADDGNGSTDPGAIADYAAALDDSNPFAQMQGATMAQAATNDNVGAGLATIQTAEGTIDADDPYAVCYAYKHTVQDKSRHPAQWYTDATGARVREWGGEPLDSLGPTYAGLVSTAAGAYQIKLATWLACTKALALTDFSNASQDRAAIYLIQGRGGLDALKAGQFDAFIAACAPEWASLPGANYAGQGMRSIQALRDEFAQDGGVIAA